MNKKTVLIKILVILVFINFSTLGIEKIKAYEGIENNYPQGLEDYKIRLLENGNYIDL